ncbi:MAG: NADPH-dependent 7-cyano-7-deazaguanine reductase QueF [Chloroflexi bacterium]|nr:NADPH-dependent 7-cyano-7-deazaguanine reductase QueF [Chloroflexota bacterium]
MEKKSQSLLEVHDPSAIATSELERIPFEYPESATDVSYETEEFTSVCPWSGLPDFARLSITYRPGAHLVELKSLKYYLTSFRNVGILQEHVVNRVLEDLVALLSPAWMTVEAWFNERGGLRTYVMAKHPSSAPLPEGDGSGARP